MDNKEVENDILNEDFDKDFQSNDYKFLVQKLKNIKESIHLLDKNTLKKDT